MDIVTPDLSHMDFLDLATSDIKSSYALLQAREYHNAVYHFQQSVEKSCKYLGLTMKLFTFDELRQISHEPQRVFDKIFSSKIFTDVYRDNDYDLFKKEIHELSTDDKTYYSYNKIQNSINRHHEERLGKLPSEIVVEHYSNNPFSIHNSSISVLIENAKVMKGYPKCENICEQLIARNDNMEICVFSQMLMSFLVSGVEANSRYPDKKGATPNNIYSEKSTMVQYLDYFIEKQLFCIEILENYFKAIERSVC